MDKKTLGLMAALGLVIAFVFFYSTTAKVDINRFVQFGEYVESPQGTGSARQTFKDILTTPTPSPSPWPTLPPP